MKVSPKTVADLIKLTKQIIEFARSEDVRDIAQQLWQYVQGSPGDASSTDDDPNTVSRALHRLHARTPPRIALAGMTSSGKSSLLNALFGLPVNDVRRTPDTTDCVIQVPFGSGLTIYDTPGLAGNEHYENVARAFLQIPQDRDLETITSIPFVRLGATRSACEVSMIREKYPIDAVLFLVDLSRTLSRFDKKAIRSTVLELGQRYGSGLIIAGSHLDVLQQYSSKEIGTIVETFQALTDNLLTPISSVTGEGLTSLVQRTFQVLPSGVSLSSLQETLLEERKASRLQFVVAEAAGILAQVALLDGKATNDLRAWIVVLYLLVCQHYSVDEETWLRLNGDISQIHDHVSKHGVSKIRRERNAEGFLEWFRSRVFGTKFFENATEFRRLGCAGLREIVPRIYTLIYDVGQIAAVRRSGEEIAASIDADANQLDMLIARDDATGIAGRLADILVRQFSDAAAPS